MKRETRANLLFLVLFILISVPGAVILVKKKMVPGAPSMAMPDAVIQRLPYMSPLDTPPQIARIVPSQTSAWVAALTRDRADGSPVLMLQGDHGPQPLMSDDHLLQVTSIKATPQTRTISMILWDPHLPADTNAGKLTFSAITSQGALCGQILQSEKLPVPVPIIRELSNAGLIQPPSHVLWIVAEIGVNQLQESGLRWVVRVADGANTSAHSVTLPADHDSQ